MNLYTHVNFERAFRYYEERLGGNITTMIRAKDLPPDAPTPPGSPDAVIHARMRIAGADLIGNDVPSERFEPMRSAYLYLSVDSPEAAEEAYEALTVDGEVGMPMAETFFATRFAQVRDQLGTLWTILHERPR